MNNCVREREEERALSHIKCSSEREREREIAAVAVGTELGKSLRE